MREMRRRARPGYHALRETPRTVSRSYAQKPGAITVFSCVTGADFARSIRWARKQPPNIINAAIREFLMTSPTASEIQNAINAAEPQAKPLASDNAPVIVANKTLLTLIAAAKEYLELRD